MIGGCLSPVPVLALAVLTLTIWTRHTLAPTLRRHAATLAEQTTALRQVLDHRDGYELDDGQVLDLDGTTRDREPSRVDALRVAHGRPRRLDEISTPCSTSTTGPRGTTRDREPSAPTTCPSKQPATGGALDFRPDYWPDSSLTNRDYCSSDRDPSPPDHDSRPDTIRSVSRLRRSEGYDPATIMIPAPQVPDQAVQAKDTPRNPHTVRLVHPGKHA